MPARDDPAGGSVAAARPRSGDESSLRRDKPGRGRGIVASAAKVNARWQRNRLVLACSGNCATAGSEWRLCCAPFFSNYNIGKCQRDAARGLDRMNGCAVAAGTKARKQVPHCTPCIALRRGPLPRSTAIRRHRRRLAEYYCESDLLGSARNVPVQPVTTQSPAPYCHLGFGTSQSLAASAIPGGVRHRGNDGLSHPSHPL